MTVSQRGRGQRRAKAATLATSAPMSRDLGHGGQRGLKPRPALRFRRPRRAWRSSVRVSFAEATDRNRPSGRSRAAALHDLAHRSFGPVQRHGVTDKICAPGARRACVGCDDMPPQSWSATDSGNGVTSAGDVNTSVNVDEFFPEARPALPRAETPPRPAVRGPAARARRGGIHEAGSWGWLGQGPVLSLTRCKLRAGHEIANSGFNAVFPAECLGCGGAGEPISDLRHRWSGYALHLRGPLRRYCGVGLPGTDRRGRAVDLQECHVIAGPGHRGRGRMH